MAWCREGAEVSCGQQDGGGGGDPDSWHGSQNLGKRVSINHRFHFAGDQATLSLEFLDLGGHPWE